MRWLKKILLTVVVLFIIILFACNIWIVKSTEAKVFSDLTQLPDHRIGLVLGTSHRSVGGGPNPFFQNSPFIEAITEKDLERSVVI